jgi:curved DNA-binding protein CbpA
MGRGLENYELLDVAPDAEATVIKGAYLRLSRSLHPDMPTGSSTLFGMVAEAYEVLRDPQKRASYDRSLAGDPHAPHTGPPSAPPSGPRKPPPSRSPNAPPSRPAPAAATTTPASRRPTVASTCAGCGKTVQPNAWILHPRYCAGRA